MRKDAAVRVVELEALKEQGLLTEAEEAELAELQPRVAQRKQQKKEYNAKRRRVGKEDAARVVELEAKGLGLLTEAEEAELAELQPRVAQRKQQKNEYNAKYRRVGKEDAARVVELEAKGLGQLTEEEKKELAELQPRVAQRKQQKRKRTRSGPGRERMLPSVLWSWRS
ncbi:hypothetical protein [Saccharopolyspora spinosa]|uniref:hypothetical protein n=1 Tax=Saccharopolyspora spinosa TaxID=60894 RepID=UPI00376F1D97